jgi:kumamolisin
MMFRKLSTSLPKIVALVPIVSIVCLAQSLPLLTRHVRDVTLNGQVKPVGRLPETQPMRLVLVLPLRNEASLDSLLADLYNPSSPSYHQFLTVEEFTSMFGPSQEDYDAVVSFAKTKGLTVVGTSRNRMNVDVTGPVANIEDALHVSMSVYQHPTENRTFFGPDREPTPDLSVQLWHISGLDNYSIPQPALVRRPPGVQPAATTGSCPSKSFCGSDMRAAYYGGTTLTGSGQSLGLLEYLGTDLADLNRYFKNAGQTNHVPVTLLSTDGTSTSCLASAGCDDTEQTLDMTQAIGMAPGLSSLVMYVGSEDSAIFNAMATASPLNAQLSSSWTWSPADPSTDNPYFKEFATQGQNLFQAAGDSGKWTRSSPIYPADDVYLTSVGGTDLETSHADGAWSSETAWVDGGGGISPNKFAIPSWQTTTAAGCANCSKTYRNGPDVSANSNFTFYVCADQTSCTANEYGGTSFAAPMWAGYLALANQKEVANGGKPLGFINPTLYTIGLGSTYDTDFHDITSGSNGYSATTGYDLATGLGSPNGSNLIKALTASN